MDLTSALLLLQTTATLSLTGLIWFVQVVHYPLLGSVGEAQFAAYHARHTRRTGRVVAPLMLTEALTASFALIRPPEGVPGWQLWLGLSLVGSIWASTASLQIPCHNRLSHGYDEIVHRRLVSTNWIRVVGWSARALLLLAWL